MNNLTTNLADEVSTATEITTGEPVATQAPTDEVSTVPDDEVSTVTKITTREPVATQAPTDPAAPADEDVFANLPLPDCGVSSAPGTPVRLPADKLPDGYLSNGFMETTSDGKCRFLKRDYVDRFAKKLAFSLTSGTPALSATAFRSAFLRDAKKLLRRGTPDGAKLTAVATMQVQAIKLVAQSKAPAVLVDMFAKLAPAVTDAETFQALHSHLDAVYTYMLQNQQQKGGNT